MNNHIEKKRNATDGSKTSFIIKTKKSHRSNIGKERSQLRNGPESKIKITVN
jgi:hypothetical protein